MYSNVIFCKKDNKEIETEDLHPGEAPRIFSAVDNTLQPVISGKSSNLKIDRQIDGLYVTSGKIKFRATGLTADNLHRLKIALATSWVNSDEPPFVQYLDLYRQDQIDFYADELFKAIGVKPSIFKREVRQLIAVLEKERVTLLQGKEPDTAGELSEDEKTEALSFLKSPNLLEDISESLSRIGIVGEEKNSLLLYLVATSRFLPVPVGAVITAPSGAGKSHLVRSLLSAFPNESVHSFSRVSSKALLHYSGILDRKIMSVDSDSISELSTLLTPVINDQKITTLITRNAEKLNRKTAEEITSQCRTAVILSTQNPNSLPSSLRQSLLNISLDESCEQTSAILQAQLSMFSVSGKENLKEIERQVRILQNSQRFLKPLEVFLPDELLLECRGIALVHRKSLKTIISIAQSIALLHQYQRDNSSGFLLLERSDLETAISLTKEALLTSTSELSTPGMKLLRAIKEIVQDKESRVSDTEKQVEFTRQELRNKTGWSESYLRVILKELQGNECISRIAGSQGSQYRYILLDNESDLAELRGDFALDITN